MKKKKILLFASFLSSVALCGGLLLQTNLNSNQVAATDGEKFVKVTSDSDLTDGKYLIVYEAGGLAFDGSLTTLDAVGNSIKVTINKTDSSINWSEELEKSVFEYSKTAKTLKSASGFYIGKTANSNGLDAKATMLTNNISFSTDGTADIVSSGGAYLRYNSNSDQTRFRYYKSTSYTGQKAISIYKLNVLENPSIKFADSNLTEIGEDTTGQFIIEKALINESDTITWLSSNEDVLAVSDDGSYLTGNVSEKTTVIVTVSAKRDGVEIATASIEITVLPKISIESVSISNGEIASIRVGDKLKLTALVSPTNANQNVTWESNNKDVCTVDSDGNVEGVSDGNAVITAKSVSDETKSASIEITVDCMSIKTARSKNANVVIKGVVTSVDSSQNQATIQDDTASILLYKLNDSLMENLVVGKNVKVSGSPVVLNGLAELTDISSIEVLGDGTLPTPIVLENTSSSDLKGLDSTIFAAEGKLKTASTFNSSNVTLTLTLTNGKTIPVYVKANVAKAIASNWNTFIAKAGTIATVKFTLPLGWHNAPQLLMLPDMAKVESADVDAVDAFVTNFMHPEVEKTDVGTGKCSSEGWYLAAKEAYGKLSEDQQKMFDTLSGYKDMKARYNAWAAVAETGSGLFSISSASNNNSMIAIVCMSLILVASLAGFAIYRKRKA